MAVTFKGQSAIYEGTSTDTKPTDVDNNTIFKELDTGINYYYDGTDWNEIPKAGGGGFTPTETQLTAMNSGIDSTKVNQIETNKNNILSKANTTDVNTATANLQAQIDQIARAAGTGSADTEVAQARVDADGTTYNTLKDRLDTQDRYISQSAEEIGSNTVVYTSTDYTSTAIYLTNGTSREFDGWYSTDFVDCSHHDTVTYDSYAFYMNARDLAYVAFFDESKTMISCLKSSDTTNGEKIGTVNVPSGAKYVRSIYTSATEMTPMLQLNATGMKKDLQQIEAANISLTYNSKICCIGDSLTQGVDGGSHIIKENYPYFMSQYLNCTVLNYGQKGRTARGWWNNYKDYYTYDSTIDVVLIMFGTNGGLQNNTIATDVEPYDNPDDYADTNVGCYCKLIEKIMADTQNHAQIILLTPPYSTYSSQQEQNVIDSEPTIRAIAKRYQLPVIDVLNECGMGKFNGDVFRPLDGCHFNAKGYHRLGTFIGSKVKSMISTFDIDEEYDDETPIGE